MTLPALSRPEKLFAGVGIVFTLDRVTNPLTPATLSIQGRLLERGEVGWRGNVPSAISWPDTFASTILTVQLLA